MLHGGAGREFLTFCGSREAKRHHRSDDAEDLSLQQCVNFSRVGIGSDQLQTFAMRDENFLNLRAGEVAVDGVRDAGGTLKC